MAPHKTTCKTVKTHKKRKKRLERPTFRSQVCLAVQFYCFFLNGVHYEETINRCSFIDRTKGLVSRGCAVFNGLIRDRAKLCKITAALQAGVAWEDRTQSDIYKWKVFKKTKPKKTEDTFFFFKTSHQQNSQILSLTQHQYFSARYTDEEVIWVKSRSILIELLPLMLLPGRICGQHNSVKLQYSLTSNFLCMFSHAR